MKTSCATNRIRYRGAVSAKYWPTSLNTCAVQVTTKDERTAVSSLDGAHRIAFSVVGAPLEVFEITRGLLWARLNLPKLLPGTVFEVWGGDWSDPLSS